MPASTNDDLRFARQSAIRVRSGLWLVAVLLAVALGAMCVNLWWLVKLAGIAAGFFAFVSALEFANAHLKRQRARRHAKS